MSSKVWDYIVLTVVVIGAINWGLIGFFKFDLVSWLFWQYVTVNSDHLCHRRSWRTLSSFPLWPHPRLFPGIKKCVKKESGQPAPFILYYVLFVKN